MQPNFLAPEEETEIKHFFEFLYNLITKRKKLTRDNTFASFHKDNQPACTEFETTRAVVLNRGSVEVVSRVRWTLSDILTYYK